jgi:hypothetical protein
MSNNSIYLMLRSGSDEMKVEGTPELVGRFVRAAYPGGFELIEQGQVSGGLQSVSSQVAPVNGGSDDWQKRLLGLIGQVKPQNQVVEVLLITYFYQRHEGLESLSLEEYEQAYNALRRIPIEPPSNLKSSVRNVVDRSKYLRNAERGRYMLTLAGEEYVENLLAERGASA